MFIEEDEAQRRMRSEENLVNRVSRDHSDLLDKPAPEVLPLENTDDLDLDAILGDLSSKDDIENFSPAALNRLIDSTGYKGRGTKNLHRDVQAGIGLTASYLGTTIAARTGDVAISQAHSYERGYTGPVDLTNPLKTPKEELQERIILGHGVIVDKCFNRLLKSLDLLDDAKLEGVKKAESLTMVAKNLSTIIGHAAQATQHNGMEVNEKSVHFHIMRPEQATDADYQTIDVNSEKEEVKWSEHALKVGA